MKSSDIDFTILTNSYVKEDKALECVSAALSIVLPKNRYKITFVNNARIPVIKVVDNKKKHFDFDICINNVLGLINTHLLKAYSRLHPKVKQVSTSLGRVESSSNCGARLKRS